MIHCLKIHQSVWITLICIGFYYSSIKSLYSYVHNLHLFFSLHGYISASTTKRRGMGVQQGLSLSIGKILYRKCLRFQFLKSYMEKCKRNNVHENTSTLSHRITAIEVDLSGEKTEEYLPTFSKKLRHLFICCLCQSVLRFYRPTGFAEKLRRDIFTLRSHFKWVIKYQNIFTKESLDISLLVYFLKQ